MIRIPWLAIISLVFLVAAGGWALKQFIFLQTAVSTQGQVLQVNAHNGTCGGKRNHRHPCTRFDADIAFQAQDGSSQQLNISAGRTRGHNHPIAEADLKVGDMVPLIYNPQNPSDASENNFLALWQFPIMLLIFHVVTLLFSLLPFKPKKNLQWLRMGPKQE